MFLWRVLKTLKYLLQILTLFMLSSGKYWSMMYNGAISKIFWKPKSGLSDPLNIIHFTYYLIINQKTLDRIFRNLETSKHFLQFWQLSTLTKAHLSGFQQLNQTILKCLFDNSTKLMLLLSLSPLSLSLSFHALSFNYSLYARGIWCRQIQSHFHFSDWNDLLFKKIQFQ